MATTWQIQYILSISVSVVAAVRYVAVAFGWVHRGSLSVMKSLPFLIRSKRSDRKDQQKYFYWPFQCSTSFWGSILLFIFCVCLYYIALSVPCGPMVSWWERADLCSLVCCAFLCLATFPYGVTCQGVVFDCRDSYSLPSSLLLWNYWNLTFILWNSLHAWL